MAEEREVNTPSGEVRKFNFDEMSPEQMKALAVEILDRGVTASRFQIDLPPDMYGEWVPNYALSVREMQAKGFTIDKIFAKEAAVREQSGDHGNIIGDVIYMTCPKVWKDTLDEEKHRRFVAMNGTPGQNIVAEEKDYTNNAKTLSKYGIGHFEASKTQNVPASELNKT
jgi:hypothetical protein